MSIRSIGGTAINYLLHYGWITCILIAMCFKTVITSPWWGYYLFVIWIKGESNVIQKTVDYIMRYC